MIVEVKCCAVCPFFYDSFLCQHPSIPGGLRVYSESFSEQCDPQESRPDKCPLRNEPVTVQEAKP